MKNIPYFDNKKINSHIQILKKNVFQTESKWPQFELLINDILNLSKIVTEQDKVISLERTLLYGGNSLFAPIFSGKNFFSIDCSPESANERGAYNQELVNHPDFIKIPYNHRSSIESLDIGNDVADMILVPNLIHHIKDQHRFFQSVSNLLKPGGYLYVFDAILRELHQIPDDYLRYTPYGIEAFAKKFEFDLVDASTVGGPFTAIAYCWIQALEYLPIVEREKFSKWFSSKHFPRLIELEKNFPNNLCRSHTAFPTAYSVLFKNSKK